MFSGRLAPAVLRRVLRVSRRRCPRPTVPPGRRVPGQPRHRQQPVRPLRRRRPDGDFVVVWTDAILDGSQEASGGSVQLRRSHSRQPVPRQHLHAECPAAARWWRPRATATSSSAWMSNGQVRSPTSTRSSASGSRPRAPRWGWSSRSTPRPPSTRVFPKIASDADGDFMVVWQADAADPNVPSTLGCSTPPAPRWAPSSGSTPSPPTSRATRRSPPARGATSSSPGRAPSRTAAVRHLAKRFNSAGAALAIEFQVNTFTSNNQYVPAIAAEADGDFTVVWQSKNQEGAGIDGLGIFGRRFSSSGIGQAIEFMVNTFTTNVQRKPHIGADDNGDFVVTWESWPGWFRHWHLRPARHRGRRPFGPVFKVNSYTVNDQKQIFTNSPFTTGQAVDFDADGDFVIAWDHRVSGRQRERRVRPALQAAPARVLDIDGNGMIDPLTDGLLILRDHFGFSGISPNQRRHRRQLHPLRRSNDHRLPHQPGLDPSTSTTTASSTPSPTGCSVVR